MKMTIKNATTSEIIEITRSVTHTHPAWVHEQLGTSGDGELQDLLDQYDITAIGQGRDVCGVECEGPSDEEICDIVHEAITKAFAEGDNWPDYVDAALQSAGVTLHDQQPDGTDQWEIARLADGRMIYLSDESARGGARYRIA